MPELPEVETVRRGLAPFLQGSIIEDVVLRRPNLRFAFPPDFTDRLKGRTIRSVARRAKYLLLNLDNDDTWLSHLGMTGNFRINDQMVDAPRRYYSTNPKAKHDHVEISLKNSEGRPLNLIYSDPRRFGFMDLFSDPTACAYLNQLGPEPLGNSLTADHLAQRFKGRRTPIKSALLDQRNIAGLGNIYVCEALWRAGVAPQTLAKALVADDETPKPALELLVRAIRDVLSAAIEAGGSTLNDFRNTDGEAGYFQHNFDVYDREDAACHTKECTGTIVRLVQSGRSSFYCPTCQVELG